jgi:hypothetical protein
MWNGCSEKEREGEKGAGIEKERRGGIGKHINFWNCL